MNLKLEDMQKADYVFSSQCAEKVPMTKYEKVFTSGHRLIIVQLMNNLFILTFYGKHDNGGEITKDTAEQCLEVFNNMFNSGEIRTDLMNGFEY